MIKHQTIKLYRLIDELVDYAEDLGVPLRVQWQNPHAVEPEHSEETTNFCEYLWE